MSNINIKDLEKELQGTWYSKSDIKLWEAHGLKRLYLACYTGSGNVSGKTYLVLDENNVITGIEQKGNSWKATTELFEKYNGYKVAMQ